MVEQGSLSDESSDNLEKLLQRRITRRKALGTGGKVAIGAAVAVVAAGGAAAYIATLPPSVVTSTVTSTGTTTAISTLSPSTVTSTATSVSTATTTATSVSTATTTATSVSTATTTATSTLTGAGVPGGTINIGQYSYSGNIDPVSIADSVSYQVVETVYQGLTRFDTTLQLQPALAESWDISPDGTVYTFHLRQGVKFHNGKAFKADDVKFTFERIKNAKTGSAPFFFPYIQSVDIIDDYTVKITNSQPYGPMLSACALQFGSVVPNLSAADLAAIGGDFSNNAIGTGPFMLTERIMHERETFKKFENYWGTENGVQLPYLDGFVQLPITDDTVRYTSLLSGDIDMGYQMAAERGTALLNDSRFTVKTAPYGWGCIDFNAGGKAIGDMALKPGETVNSPRPLKIRQAVCKAINRKELVDTILSGYGEVVNVPLPHTHPYYYEVPGFLDQDIDGSKALQAEAGYPNGVTVYGFTVTVLWLPDMAKLVKDQLAAANITLDLQVLEVAKGWDLFYTGTGFDIVAADLAGSKIDPVLSMAPYPAWSYGIQPGMVPEWDTLHDAAIRATDPNQIRSLSQQMYAFVLTSGWGCPVFIPHVLDTWKANIHSEGRVPMRDDIYLDNTWIKQ